MATSFFERLPTYLGEQSRWLFSARSALLWLSPFGVLLLVATVPAAMAIDTTRYAGLIFQLFGIWIVASGILGRQRLLGIPGAWQAVRAWWRRRPRWRPRPVSGSLGTALGRATASAKAQLWWGCGADADLAARLDVLEKNLQLLREVQATHERTTEDALRDLREQNERERYERARAVAGVEQQLRDTVAGDILGEWVGVYLVGWGTVLSGIPEELVKLLR